MSLENSADVIALTITFIDPDLTEEELNEDAVRLLEVLSDRSDIESVDRIREAEAPIGSMGIAKFVAGSLRSLVSRENLKRVLSFLGGCLKPPISLELEGRGRKLKITVNNLQELESVIQKSKEFLEG